MQNEKAILRQKQIVKRKSLADKQVKDYSQKIADRLIRLIDWDNVKNIHIYNSRSDWKEVSTNYIKKYIEKSWPKIIITSPASNKYDVLPTQKYDLIIVPVLSFDRDNYRLGLGAGWYDRFLSTQPQAQTVGLAYSKSLIGNLPHEPHDVPMGTIITEKT